MSNANRTPSKLQQGSTLLVAVVILLLASLMALMAMNVGVFEQRSSGNDLRAKVVHQVAEAGLAQGFEFLFRANPALLDNAGSWELCGATDTTFPCGAVDASVRGTMYRLAAGAGGYDATGSVLPTALTQRMLTVPATLPQMGGFNVDYGVAPVLCRVAAPISSTAITCTTDLASASDRRVVTFVSVAQIDGDAGRTTLTQTVARSSIMAPRTGVPSVVAMGSVDPSGGGSIVAMPDAAGPGLDLSIWTRKSIDMGSRFATCSRQSILETGGLTLTNANWRDDVIDTSCPASSSEGWDILDADGNVGQNRDVVQAEFPCDLFEFAFNVKAWSDTDGDGFCETRMAKVAFEAPDGNTYQLYPDEALLYKYATKIIGGDSRYVRAEQVSDGSDLGSSTTGLIWCKSGCSRNIPSRPAKLGSPTSPVILVVDDDFQNNATIVFGLVFLRDSNATMSETTGGAATIKLNGSSAAVFGSVFVQGEFSTGSGNSMVFGDRDIWLRVVGTAAPPRFDTLRGGWTDGLSY